MFDQILVPTDRSLLAEHILPHTIAMARAYGSQVMLISVMDPNLESNSSRPIDPWGWQIQRAEAEAYLQSMSASLQARALTAKTILLEGKVPDDVIRQSNLMGTNLIMLSSHGQGKISSWNTSSVVTKIIQQTRTSVMLIRSAQSDEQPLKNLCYRRIMVPVDGSQRGEYGLFAVARLARAHGAELLAVSVITPPDLPRRTLASARDRALVPQLVESNRAEASQYLDALKASLDCQLDTRLLVNESVPEALHNLVEQEKIDLVILNAHGFGGSLRWLYGNVAVNFLAYSTAPLLIIQDFERDLLIETKAEAYVSEFLGHQQPAILNESREGFRDIYE